MLRSRGMLGASASVVGTATSLRRRSSPMTDPSETVQASVARINDQDVAGLLALMTPDHRLIDPGGEVVTGVENVQQAWDGYFRMVPDYCVRVGGSRSCVSSRHMAGVRRQRADALGDGARMRSEEAKWPM